jgi:uncharacterized protein
MLAQLLGSKLRARILGWLMMHPGERFYVRQLTVILGGDSTNVSRELARMAGMGILTCSPEGRQKYYSVNQAHPAYADLHGLVLKTSGLGDLVRAALAPFKDRIRCAFIFGSFARDEVSANSDIDLMVVGDITLREVAAALAPVGRTLGRELNPVLFTPAEFTAKAHTGHHFITAILKEPKLYLMGNENVIGKLAG